MRARASLPCIIFFDELDALVGSRDLTGGSGSSDDVQSRILSTLLNEIDGIQAAEGLLVVAATNQREAIDPALLRHGRFGSHVFVGLPTEQEREEVLRIAFENMPIDDQTLLRPLAAATPGYSGADLHNLAREAAMNALRSGSSKISATHIPQVRLMSGQKPPPH